MTTRRTGLALTLITILAIAGCSTPGAATQVPGATTPAATSPAATTTGGEPTSPPVAGEPCSFMTADEVGAIIGETPVEVAERAGRGDCDYWLSEAHDQKVNIGVTTGPDAVTLFENTKGLGSPEAVSIGDEAYSINSESLGAIVVARKGDSVAIVQVLFGLDADEQLADAIAIAEGVVAKL